MPMPQLADGTRMQLGQSRIEYAGTFAGGAITGAFEARFEDNGGTVQTGTTTFNTSPYPSLSLLSRGVANDKAILRFIQDLDATKLQAVWIRLEGLLFSIEGGYDIAMRLCTPAVSGVTIRHKANDGTAPPADLRLDKPSSSDTATTFRFYGPDASLSPALRPRSIELRWHPQRKRAYIIEEGSELCEVDTTAAVIGTIRPQLSVTTKNTTPRGFTCERIVVGYEHN